MELMIIECQSCGNSFKGDISKPFICPKCREKNVHVSDSRHTSVLKKTLSEEEKIEINKVEEPEAPVEEKKNIETITNFNQPDVIEAIKQAQGVTEEPKISENPIQAQINKILEETEQKKKEKEQIIQPVISGNLDNSLASEIIKRLNKLDMEYSIIEALLKEILSRLSNN